MIERAEMLVAHLRRMTPKAREKLAAEGISERELQAVLDALRATARPPEIRSKAIRRRPSDG